MKTNYVLIDYENVQPKNLAILSRHDFKVLVFVGANQTKVPFELAAALQAFGENAEYIKIHGNGSNALDFHIAFYIGQLAERDPNSSFHIISKDTGFDPLINHLRSRKTLIHRVKTLAEIPLSKVSKATSEKDKLAAVVESLIARGQSRPRRVKTLSNTINALFLKALDDGEVASLISQLKKRKWISVDNEKVAYALPDR
jgi:hypothetical protein